MIGYTFAALFLAAQINEPVSLPPEPKNHSYTHRDLKIGKYVKVGASLFPAAKQAVSAGDMADAAAGKSEDADADRLPIFKSRCVYMKVDLKERANDYKEAFETLKKEKGVGKVYFQIVNGATITNIIDMTLTGNGHLILFKFNSPQGIKFQVVPVEQIATLSYAP